MRRLTSAALTGMESRMLSTSITTLRPCRSSSCRGTQAGCQLKSSHF